MTHPIATVQTPKINPIIDLTDSLPDITANVIHNSEHFHLPSDIFEIAILQALNDLIDQFALDPDEYLTPQHKLHIDSIAAQYLNS